MPYASGNDPALPDYVRRLSKKKRDQWVAVWMSTYNSTAGSVTDKEKAAFAAANGTVLKKKEGLTMPEDIQALEEGNRRQALTELHYSKFEVIDNEGGPAKISGIISVCNQKNLNGRLYSTEVMSAAIEKIADQLDRHPGFVDHPEGTPSVGDIGIRWTRMFMDGDLLRGEGEIVPTQRGQDLLRCIEAGVEVGISTRGFGSTTKGTWKGEDVVFISSFDLDGADAVAFPSNVDARLSLENLVRFDYSTLSIEELQAKRPDFLDALVQVLTERITTQGISDMNEDNIEEKELNTEPMVEKEPVVEPVAETIAEETLVEKTETLVEENPLQSELTEAKSKVDALMAELEDAKSKVEETKNVLTNEIASMTAKYEETAEKLTEIEAEKTALAEDVANMKTLIDLCAKEIGEKAKSKDFYGAQSMAMMGGEMQYMHDREMKKSMESLVTAAEGVVSALGVQNLRDYIVQRCRPERYSYPLADELMKVCTSKEDVDSKFDEIKAKVESHQVSSRPTTKGIVYNTESALSDTDRAALEKIRELRGYR